MGGPGLAVVPGVFVSASAVDRGPGRTIVPLKVALPLESVVKLPTNWCPSDISEPLKKMYASKLLFGGPPWGAKVSHRESTRPLSTCTQIPRSGAIAQPANVVADVHEDRHTMMAMPSGVGPYVRNSVPRTTATAPPTSIR